LRRAGARRYGTPEVLVSDGGGILCADDAKTLSAALGITKREPDRGQPWQDGTEPNFDVRGRLEN
jgi:hypothetical protein